MVFFYLNYLWDLYLPKLIKKPPKYSGFLLDKLNINYNVDHFFLRGVDGLSRENVSSDSFKFYFHPPGNKDYRELYNTDTKNLVEEYQMKTIKHFNYKF